jgi:hypothetical protein
MKNLKLWGSLVVFSLALGTTGVAAACEGGGSCGGGGGHGGGQHMGPQVSTTAGFQIGRQGGVTALTVSSAVSPVFAHSSGVINTGGVYTEAFASRNDRSAEAIKAPRAIENGSNVNTVRGDTVLMELPPGGSINIGDGSAVVLP